MPKEFRLKDKLIQISTKLFMSYGLKSVSMDDISREAGISKKTLYQHFENKETLINTALQEILIQDKDNISQIIENKEYDAIQKMIEIFKLSIKLLQSIKPTVIYDLKKYYKNSWEIVENMHMRFIETTVEANLIQGKNERIYRNNIEPSIISKLFISKMLAVTNNTNLINTDKLTNIFFQNLLYHLYGIIDKSQIERLENLTVNFKE